MRHVQNKIRTNPREQSLLLNVAEHEDTQGHGFCLTLQMSTVALIKVRSAERIKYMHFSTQCNSYAVCNPLYNTKSLFPQTILTLGLNNVDKLPFLRERD